MREYPIRFSGVLGLPVYISINNTARSPTTQHSCVHIDTLILAAIMASKQALGNQELFASPPRSDSSPSAPNKRVKRSRFYSRKSLPDQSDHTNYCIAGKHSPPPDVTPALPDAPNTSFASKQTVVGASQLTSLYTSTTFDASVSNGSSSRRRAYAASRSTASNTSAASDASKHSEHQAFSTSMASGAYKHGSQALNKPATTVKDTGYSDHPASSMSVASGASKHSGPASGTSDACGAYKDGSQAPNKPATTMEYTELASSRAFQEYARTQGADAAQALAKRLHPSSRARLDRIKSVVKQMKAVVPSQYVDAGLQASLPARGVDAGLQASAFPPTRPAPGIGDPSNMIDLTGSDNEQATPADPHTPEPPRPAPPKRRAPVGAASMVADPIEWVLHIPTNDGHRLENFEALPAETRAALTSKYNDVFYVLPDVPNREEQEVRRHYFYVRFLETSNRESKANSKHCVKQFLYNTSKGRPCMDNFACVRCHSKKCPCVRIVKVVDNDGTSKHKLCFFPFEKPAGGDVGDAWKAVEFWTII
jgi:hypothetical protein